MVAYWRNYKLHNGNSELGPIFKFWFCHRIYRLGISYVLDLIKNAKCFSECKVFIKRWLSFIDFFLQYIMFCRTGNDNLASFGNAGFSVVTHIPFKVFDSTSTCWHPVIDKLIVFCGAKPIWLFEGVPSSGPSIISWNENENENVYLF